MIINYKENNGSKIENRKSKCYFVTSLLRYFVKRKGFSLTEILITVSLLFLLVSAGIGGYFRFYKNSLISADVDNVMTLMKYTRFNALKNPTNSNYGVHLDVAKNSIIAFRSAYNPFDTSNNFVLLKELRIEDLNLMPSVGVTNEIIFKNQTGKTDNTGSFVIGNDNFTYTFSINEQGIVN